MECGVGDPPNANKVKKKKKKKNFDLMMSEHCEGWRAL
jgi:hypothetical protein